MQFPKSTKFTLYESRGKHHFNILYLIPFKHSKYYFDYFCENNNIHVQLVVDINNLKEIEE